jgi:hypothetical protein
MLAEIRGAFGELCFDTVIRSCVRLREAARRGLPIVRIASRSNGTLDYGALAIEVAAAAPVRTLRAASEAARRGAPTEQREPARSVAGARPDPTPPALREVVVEFRDAAAEDVRIAGDFNGWVPDRGVESRRLQEGDTTVWRKVLRVPPGTYAYRYVVDGEWRTDPANPDRLPTADGPASSRLTVR